MHCFCECRNANCIFLWFCHFLFFILCILDSDLQKCQVIVTSWIAALIIAGEPPRVLIVEVPTTCR